MRKRDENAAGRFKNIEKAKAIYHRSTVSLQWASYADFLKGDGVFFPKYRYVDWNASLDEINAIAKDVTSSLIQGVRDELSAHAKTVSETATEQINTALSERMRGLLTDIPSIRAIKTKVKFDIQERLIDTMVNKVGGDGDIRIESQGEGVKKQIWLALLRLGSLQGIAPDEQRKKFIWCFDEPESSSLSIRAKRTLRYNQFPRHEGLSGRS